MYTVKRFSKASKEEKKLKELKPEGGLGLATLNLNRSSVRKGAARALKGYEEGKLNKGEAIKKAKKEGFKEGLKRSAVIGAVGGLISARGAKKRTEKTIDKSIKFK